MQVRRTSATLRVATTAANIVTIMAPVVLRSIRLVNLDAIVYTHLYPWWIRSPLGGDLPEALFDTGEDHKGHNAALLLSTGVRQNICDDF